MLFFISPVIYRADRLPMGLNLVWLNPLSYFIEAIRTPLLNNLPHANTYPVLLGMLTIGSLVTWAYHRAYGIVPRLLGVKKKKSCTMAEITLQHATIRYPVYGSHGMSLRSHLLRVATGGNIEKDARTTVVTALRGRQLPVEGW